MTVSKKWNLALYSDVISAWFSSIRVKNVVKCSLLSLFYFQCRIAGKKSNGYDMNFCITTSATIAHFYISHEVLLISLALHSSITLFSHPASCSNQLLIRYSLTLWPFQYFAWPPTGPKFIFSLIAFCLHLFTFRPLVSLSAWPSHYFGFPTFSYRNHALFTHHIQPNFIAKKVVIQW